MTQKQAQQRDALMRELLAVTRQMVAATTNYEKRHLIVRAENLQARIKRFDGDVLFAVV